ncbi:MAG: NAD(P)/FAD-dependent oxidoreductase [Candidatus Margulisiibacteriota bacterium]
MKKPQKIIIIGAGPIGCYLGQLLKQQGMDALLIEEHPEVGRPIQCAGIVGKSIFDDIRLPLSKDSIQNTIDGAIIQYQDASFELKRESVAYIIDRSKFDSNLAVGLNIKLSTEVQDINKIEDGYLIKTNNGEFFADLVIGADGPNSKVRRTLGFASDMKLYRGYQYRVKTEPKVMNKVIVKYIKPFSLFTWVIPESENTIRIGTICNNPYQELNDFMRREGIKGDILEKNAGAIPIGICDLVKGNAALVGDAACHIKPITSGGIYYGLKSAELLADSIKDGNLSLYPIRWEEKFGKEMKICLLLRYIMENMENDVSKKLFEYVKENVPLVEQLGDFENHSSIAWGLLSNRLTFPTIGAVVLGMVKNPKVIFNAIFRK